MRVIRYTMRALTLLDTAQGTLYWSHLIRKVALFQKKTVSASNKNKKKRNS